MTQNIFRNRNTSFYKNFDTDKALKYKLGMSICMASGSLLLSCVKGQYIVFIKMERHCVIFTKNSEFSRTNYRKVERALPWYSITILTTRVYKYRGTHYQSRIPTDICSQNSVNCHKYDWFSTMLQRVAIVAMCIVISVYFFLLRFAGRMKTCNRDR